MVVPCFAGFTLPRVSSRVCAPTGVQPARVRIATISAASRARSMTCSSPLGLFRVLAVGGLDLGLDAAAHVEVAHYLDPARLGGGGKVVQDPVGDVLMEGPLVPVRPDVELERLELDQVLVGDVADAEGGEVGLAGAGAEAGKLGDGDVDFVVAVRVRVGDDFELRGRLSRHG